ncbi:hypothetical protein MHYP_G00311980 [Metynnis hypsauchen]
MNETPPILDTAILQRTMGNAKSGMVSREVLNDLKVSTKFSEAEITQWYENFQKQCPSGRITLTQFEEIYSRFFPNSDAKTYAQHVFRSFDTNDDGTLDFKEYIVALHMTSSGKMSLKLEWAFSLFDVDKNGYITKNEVCEICQASDLVLVSCQRESYASEAPPQTSISCPSLGKMYPSSSIGKCSDSTYSPPQTPPLSEQPPGLKVRCDLVTGLTPRSWSRQGHCEEHLADDGYIFGMLSEAPSGAVDDCVSSGMLFRAPGSAVDAC